MQDTSLYQQILGDTAPWVVSDVSLDVDSLTVNVTLSLPSDTVWACPKCEARMHVKEWRTRRWRHLDSCQFKTVLEARIPAVECSEHGVQTAQVPWADKSSRFTMLFECLAIKILEACPGSKAAELLGISWDQADGIKQRAVARGMDRRSLEGLEYLCIDEKCIGRGYTFFTVVSGKIAGEFVVLYVGDGKDEAALDGFWELLGEDGCDCIKAVSLDMGKAYQNAVRKHCPNAELIFDPFHIMKMINEAVNDVRKRESCTGTKATKEALKGSRRLWLWGVENVPEKHSERFEELKQSATKTARAWRIKELWRTFKRCVDIEDGVTFFKQWARTAMASTLEPIKKVVRTLREHMWGIVAYLKHRICNATAESINSRIQLLIQKSCGYRTRERLKTDILFHLGGLQLRPGNSQ